MGKKLNLNSIYIFDDTPKYNFLEGKIYYSKPVFVEHKIENDNGDECDLKDVEKIIYQI